MVNCEVVVNGGHSIWVGCAMIGDILVGAATLIVIVLVLWCLEQFE
jgi:hypothetical protein